MVAWSPRDRWQQERLASWPNHRFLLSFQRVARQPDRLNRPVTFGLPLALLKCVRQVERQANQEERSNPMKVKTNTKAGSAMWGS
jgi:hypothetical protein